MAVTIFWMATVGGHRAGQHENRKRRQGQREGHRDTAQQKQGK
ncbi:hypothetical protein [uncultured Roseibium sp.]